MPYSACISKKKELDGSCWKLWLRHDPEHSLSLLSCSPSDIQPHKVSWTDPIASLITAHLLIFSPTWARKHTHNVSPALEKYQDPEGRRSDIGRHFLTYATTPFAPIHQSSLKRTANNPHI